MVMAVVSVLTSVYMSGLVVEKRSYDTERNVVQALNLAEAAGNLAFAEMNKRFPPT
jgi:type II secretory pathway pseudopilin PulG